METKTINIPKNLNKLEKSKENLKSDFDSLNSAYKKTKSFVLKKENQRKALKVIGSLSSGFILTGYAFKIIPLLSPNLASTVSGKLTAMFPEIAYNIGLIPTDKLKKVSSNLCILSGIATALIGKDASPEAIKAYRSFNSNNLL